jgi:hypothetical protein
LVIVALFSKAFAYSSLNSFRTFAPITGNATLNDVHSGMVLTNLGAGGALTITSPRAIAGLHITFSLAQDVDINP